MSIDRIKVKPQPKGDNALWPSDSSHIEWGDVMIEPDYYGHCWLKGLTDSDAVSVEQDQKGEWYWVIKRG